MKGLAIFLGVILFGIALFAGGCSLAFTPALFEDPSFFMIWLSGIVIAVLAFLVGRQLFRHANS